MSCEDVVCLLCTRQYVYILAARCPAGTQESINKDRLLRFNPVRCAAETQESINKDRLLKLIPNKVKIRETVMYYCKTND